MNNTFDSIAKDLKSKGYSPTHNCTQGDTDVYFFSKEEDCVTVIVNRNSKEAYIQKSEEGTDLLNAFKKELAI